MMAIKTLHFLGVMVFTLFLTALGLVLPINELKTDPFAIKMKELKEQATFPLLVAKMRVDTVMARARREN